MRPIKILTALSLFLSYMALTGCDNDEGKGPIDGPYCEYLPWFPDCDETESMKTVIVPTDGGEIIVPTNERIVPLEDMFTNATVSGTKTSEITIDWHDSDAGTYYNPGKILPFPEFDWCNPDKHGLYAHDWLGLWQEPYKLHLYVQPNTTAEQRVMYVQPHNSYLELYGFLTVIQEGKTE